jgi:glycosyltransferase involved in cell wall biosynthesis
MGGIASVWLSKYVKYLPLFGWEPVVVTVKDAPTTIPDPSLGGDLAAELDLRSTFSLEPTRLIRLIRRLHGHAEQGGAEEKDPPHVVYSYTGLPFQLVTRIKGIFVPDEKIGWAPFALWAALEAIREGGVKLVFSSAPPYTSHLVAMACRRLAGLPWVAEFRDPWVDYPHYQPLTAFHGRLILGMERKMAEKADRLVCAMPGIVDGFGRRYGQDVAGKCALLTYGYDPDDFVGGVELDDRFNLTWIGSVYGDLYPRGLLQAVRRLLDRGHISADDIRVCFVGTMDLESSRAVAGAGLEGVVEMTGFLSHHECIERMRSAHVLLQQLARGRMSEILYTGKMFEYFGSGRPILTLAGEGDTGDLVERLGAGIVVDPGDIEAICRAVMDYYRLYKAGKGFKVDNPDIPDLFDRKKQTERLANIFDEVSGSSLQ